MRLLVNRGMRLAVALALCLSVAAVGCGRAGPPADGPPPSERGEAATVARIVCDREGTRVLTPRVEARPDGVHFVIDNRLKAAAAGYAVQFPEGGGMGENAPKGESEHVESLPPGTARIGCYESREDPEPDYGTLKVVEGDSGYKSTQLECPSGMAVGGEDGFYAPGAKGKKGKSPVDMTRRRFSEEIEEGNVVEVASYPESRDQKSVRVVREGRVVAVVEYFRESGGWLGSGYSACTGF